MTAYQTLLIGVNHQLDKALTAVGFGQVTAGIGHRKLDFLNIHTQLLCTFLAVANGSHLRVGVDDGRDYIVTHFVGLAQHVVHSNFCFPVSGVRQHYLAVAVTHSIHILPGSAHMTVGNDSGTVHLQTQGLR